MARMDRVDALEAFAWTHSRYRVVGDKWGTDCSFRLSLPKDLRPASVRVSEANVAAMKGRDVIFAVEADGGARYLQGCVVFDGDADAVEEQVSKEGFRLELAIEEAEKGR